MKRNVIIKRLGKAIDRAVAAQRPVDRDTGVNYWINAFKLEVDRLNRLRAKAP